MKSKKLLTDSYKKKVAEDAKKLVEKEVEKYESYPKADKKDIFTYEFKEMTPRLKEQYDELKEVL